LERRGTTGRGVRGKIEYRTGENIIAIRMKRS
jgi:hypothetical protein